MRNTKKRMTIMRLANVVAVGVGVDGLITDKELDELWNKKYSEIMKEGREANLLTEDTTIGQMFELLDKEFQKAVKL